MISLKNVRLQVISTMFCFFIMGSIEMVGIASNYIKVSLNLTDTQANILPSLVYIWFLVCTIPTGVLMNKVGMKKTVILSMLVLAMSTLIPLFLNTYLAMVVCFIFLGISNVALQSSAYPLFSNIIKKEKLFFQFTFGEFIKTVSCFVAPYAAIIGSLYFKNFFGLGWKVLFLFYFLITITAILLISNLKNEKEDVSNSKNVNFSSLKLLAKPFILLSFIAVMCHVGIDIGMNTNLPKLMMHKLDVSLEIASFSSALYFIFRLMGGLIWSFIIAKTSKVLFFYISVALMFIGVSAMYIVDTKVMLYVLIALVGVGNASIFPVIITEAITKYPILKDKISVLMIMGQFGGAIFPLSMGILLDYFNIYYSYLVILIGILYLLYYSLRLGYLKTESTIEMPK